MTKLNIFTAAIAAALAVLTVVGIHQVGTGSKKAEAAIQVSALRLTQLQEINASSGTTTYTARICAGTSLPALNLRKLVWSHRLKGAKFGPAYSYKFDSKSRTRWLCRTYTAPQRTGKELVTVKYDADGIKASASAPFKVIEAPPNPA